MWTGRILLLTLLLLTGGGWLDALLKKTGKAAILIAVPIVFGLTFVPTLRESCVRLCYAPCALALLAALFCPSEEPVRTVCAAALGGLIGWKLCDTFPLFPEQGLLLALPTLLLALLFLRRPGARMLALALAPFIMLLLRAIGDWMLFQSTVLELGDGDALAAQTAGMLLLLCGESVLARKRRGKGAAARTASVET